MMKYKVQKWRKAGMKKEDIAVYLCLPVSKVAQICRKLKLKKREWRTTTAIDKIRIGWEVYEIAQYFKVTESYVNKRVKAWRKENIRNVKCLNIGNVKPIGFMGMQ